MTKHLAKLVVIVLALSLAPVGLTQAQTTEEVLATIQQPAFQYFWYEANPTNGLIRDRSQSGSPCSIAAVGFGLSAICVGVDHGWVTRTDASNRVETTLETFWRLPQGPDLGAVNIGYKGFFYHFLDMYTGLRAWDSELSSIDTALLLAGILDAKQYFTQVDPVEAHIRQLADSIYTRVDWEWMRDSQSGLRMGWKPDTGFTNFGLWRGYNEAMIMYILALGSPTHPVPTTVWTYWTSGYQYQTWYGYSHIHFAPLFGHQYSHCWIDFRNIQDAYTSSKGITYYENSRRATLAQRAYCIQNFYGSVGYSDSLWGITASDGPNGYAARGAPPNENDNGTIAPTAAASSIAFAPDEVMPVLRNMLFHYPLLWGPYGFRDAFNLGSNWYDSDYLGIDQGPIVLMIENYENQSIWNRFMQNADIQTGLTRAGFVAATTTVEAPAPERSALFAAEPNPFRDQTRLRYRLASPGFVRIALYDVRGRALKSLVSETQEAGDHSVRLGAEGLSPGVYTYRLEHDGEALEQKCVVLRY